MLKSDHPSTRQRNEGVATLAPAGGPSQPARRDYWWVLAIAAVIGAFSWPLFELGRFSLGSEVYSHILLVPLVSGYLIWTQRSLLPRRAAFSVRAAIVPVAAGGLVLLIYFALKSAGWKPPPADALALTTLAFLLLLTGTLAAFLGWAVIRAIAFPLGFLVFMLPMPGWIERGIETFLQHGSASVAYGLFTIAGTPVLRQDLVFQLPGIALEVARECSGIRSTLALFITSVVAGHLFLQSPWRRTLLAVAVIPLALLRNGVRIFTIGELCVRISPEMVHSYIHRQGGPIFFLLSLIPFSLFLLLLARSERSAAARAQQTLPSRESARTAS